MTTENRESFFARLTPFMAPSELRNIEIAYMMSKYGHRGQTRKELDGNGDPIRYFEHPRRVAIILMDELSVHDPDMICAALLHDSLEDTKDVTEGILEHLYGANIVKMVKLLSKLPKEGYYDRLMRFGNPAVWIIKCADRLDNLRSLEQTPVEFQEKQVVETTQKIYPIFIQLEKDSKSDLRIPGRILSSKIASICDSYLSKMSYNKRKGIAEKLVAE